MAATNINKLKVHRVKKIEDEIERRMSPDNYIGTAAEQVEQVVKKLRYNT